MNMTPFPKSDCHNFPIEFFRDIEDDHGKRVVKEIPICTKCKERCAPIYLTPPLVKEERSEWQNDD